MCIVQAVAKAPIKSPTRRSKWRLRARLSSVEKGARDTKTYCANLAGPFNAILALQTSQNATFY
jgi:hypothetical protein